ncbi:MAG: LETM1 domain-containing protein [Planctomycetota bacterium]
MADQPDSFEEALKNSWTRFKDKLPGGIGGYLDPKTAFEKVIKNNGVAVLTELKESKEALGILWKLASGWNITEEEQQKLKSQLADLARTIPALGIFALPGGMLLLPILAKSLPWSILPSAFRQELEKKPPTEEE